MQATWLGLNAFDRASLLRLAQAYQAEIDPIHQQVVKRIHDFHARFPNGRIPAGVDHSPPPELGDLQKQEDAVTLRYRYLLQNSMRPGDFQTTDRKVLSSLGGASQLVRP